MKLVVVGMLLAGLLSACRGDETELQLRDRRRFADEVRRRASGDDFNHISPVLERARLLPLPFPPKDEGLQARLLTCHGRDYLILMNSTEATAYKVPDAALSDDWRTLFALRRDPRESLWAGGKAYYLLPGKVLVLESRIRPKRLLGL